MHTTNPATECFLIFFPVSSHILFLCHQGIQRVLPVNSHTSLLCSYQGVNGILLSKVYLRLVSTPPGRACDLTIKASHLYCTPSWNIWCVLSGPNHLFCTHEAKHAFFSLNISVPLNIFVSIMIKQLHAILLSECHHWIPPSDVWGPALTFPLNHFC